jgi:hypothetical protein
MDQLALAVLVFWIAIFFNHPWILIIYLGLLLLAWLIEFSK